MKKVIFLLVMVFSFSSIFAQNKKSESDTTKMKIGNRTIIIIEKKDNSENKENKEIEIEEEIIVVEGKEIKREKKKEKKAKKYKARKYSRWSGINLGLNQFVHLDDYSELDGTTDIWQVKPWKSRTWNINFMEFSLSIVKRHLLLTTGLGFEYRNYSFDRDIDLEYDNSENIFPIENNTIDYNKNKLHASYVQIPLLLEINTSTRPKKGLYLAGGVIGGYKMNSYVVQKYKANGQKIKTEIDDSFNLNPYQLEGTLRIGFNRFMLYTNVDLLPVFEEDISSTGDQLANVTFGIQLIGF